MRAFLPSSRWPRDTVNMQSIELVAISVAPFDLQNFFLGPLRAPEDPPGRGKTPYSLLRSRARPPNRTASFLQWIMSPRALLHRKYAVVRAVARDTVNMQAIGLASIYGAPSDDLESENCFFKKASQLVSFFLSAFLPSSTWPRDTVNMQ